MRRSDDKETHEKYQLQTEERKKIYMIIIIKTRSHKWLLCDELGKRAKNLHSGKIKLRCRF